MDSILKLPKITECSRLKIIAGQWRGRWIEFPDTQAIRPTPNRVRETLFNWLMEWTADSVCLDAFAGSGALSFEALSRGAAKVVAVEKDPAFARQIRENAARLGAKHVEVINEDFVAWIGRQRKSRDEDGYHIVFLDPPFHQNLLPKALAALVNNHLLAESHRIYFEVEKEFDMSVFEGFEILKEQVAGQVRYGLMQQRLIKRDKK